MSTIAEIEAAIRKLSPQEVEELARWLDSVRTMQPTAPAMDRWLETSRGTARTGATTDQVMAMTRGEA